jgi:septal ring factor EnvC (AmiA/AmiB activator)
MIMIERLEKEAQMMAQKIDSSERELAACRQELGSTVDLQGQFEKQQEIVRTRVKQGMAKQQALEKYIIELQKKYTELERGIEDKNEQIEELCDKDWARHMEYMKIEQKVLERLILEKQAELLNIQKYTTSLFQQGDEAPNLHILEEQSRELSLMKRLLIEKENRNNDCQRKWRDIYDVGG